MNGRSPTEPKLTVFYAWQMDRDNKTNRRLIHAAIQKALNRINKDPNIAFRLTLDHYTKGVPVTPAVTDTILQKIEKTTIFLADLTYVAETEQTGSTDKKKSVPNPNVLFELGYAFQMPHRLGVASQITVSGPVLKSLPYSPQSRAFHTSMESLENYLTLH